MAARLPLILAFFPSALADSNVSLAPTTTSLLPTTRPVPPKVRFLEGNLRIGVRTFLNPGWRRELLLPCENCSSSSRLAVRALDADPRCKGLAQQTLAAVAAALRDGQMPENVDMRNAKNSKVDEIVRRRGAVAGVPCALPLAGPCSGRAEASFSLGQPQLESVDPRTGETSFVLEGSRRLVWKERQALFHHRSALCFYPDKEDEKGWLVGFAAVHMDGGDLQSFIGFVCFFGVALPLICLVTALLHYNKYERCKQHVSQLRLEYQREQLERELSSRRPPPRPSVSTAAVGSLPMLAASLAPHGGARSGSAWSAPEQTAAPTEGYWPLAGHAAAGATASSSGTRPQDGH